MVIEGRVVLTYIRGAQPLGLGEVLGSKALV